MNRKHCEGHDKVLFTSKREALKSLTGNLKSKRVRVYECEEHRGLYHLTKEGRRYQTSERLTPKRKRVL